MRHALAAAFAASMLASLPLIARSEEAPVILNGAAADAVRVATADFRKTHRNGMYCFEVSVAKATDGTVVEFTPMNVADYPKVLPNGDLILFNSSACERVNMAGARYKIEFSGKIAERRVTSE
jgi:hypothetical protein